MWLTQEPPCRFSTRITSEFELGTWTDEGDFWFIFLRRWCNLRLRWTSCPFHFFAYIVGFFVASFDFIFSSRWRRRNFPSTPHQTLLSGVKNEVKFLHDRCIPHQNLIRQVWASVCVCVCACIANININIYIERERYLSHHLIWPCFPWPCRRVQGFEPTWTACKLNDQRGKWKSCCVLFVFFGKWFTG